jgi:hypothetical protein
MKSVENALSWLEFALYGPCTKYSLALHTPPSDSLWRLVPQRLMQLQRSPRATFLLNRTRAQLKGTSVLSGGQTRLRMTQARSWYFATEP